MSDLIDRQAVIDVVDAIFPVDPTQSEYAQGVACGAALAKTYIKQLQSVEHIEVVRCKDCKWFNLNKWAEVDGAPIIIGHEICDFWGGGCKTMSILIKGMKKPTACYKCQLRTGKYCGILTENEKCADDGVLPHCPIVEIPPHGRLIDADELIKNCEIWKETEIQDEHDAVWNRGIDACINEVKHHAPTVIESEEEDDKE